MRATKEVTQKRRLSSIIAQVEVHPPRLLSLTGGGIDIEAVLARAASRGSGFSELSSSGLVGLLSQLSSTLSSLSTGLCMATPPSQPAMQQLLRW
jgi:hypothetical protein